MITINNITNIFIQQSYTDVNLFYFLMALGFIALIVSIIIGFLSNDLWPQKLISCGISVIILLLCAAMSVNVAMVVMQPQYIENTSAWNGANNITVQHIFNQSSIEVVKMNSNSLSLFAIALLTLAFINTIYVISTILSDAKGLKVNKMVKR